ncbi:MAG TPA: hypothetical protein VG873_09355 [Burkholderiales bacterium]|nr:hypothetical protein [Burkholderiales bacterium]
MLARRHSLARYLPPSADPATYFRIVTGRAFHGFARLPCLLARAWPNGRFELLSPGWSALGYTDEEISGRSVADVMALGPVAARATIMALLTEGVALEFGLRARDGGERRFGWNRQFDDFTASMFIFGDELAGAPAHPRARATTAEALVP